MAHPRSVLSAPAGSPGPHDRGAREPETSRVRLVHRCRTCQEEVEPSAPGHLVAWCPRCRRVGLSRLTLEVERRPVLGGGSPPPPRPAG
jgi:hypothetical protein|uniref:hypothetical protein n=1 Tax=Aciditerrimonas ferrireducens TaxID=667306 RepID=UPI00366E669F